MAMTDLLRSAQGGAAMANLGQAFGLEPNDAALIVDSIVPQLSEALERNTLSRGGLADLVQALGHGHHESYLDDPRSWRDPAMRDDGNAILEHILGSKDRSRRLADRTAADTGMPAAEVRAMLPVIAGMLMGGLAKQVKQGFGDISGRAQPMAGQGGFLPKQPLPRSQPRDEPPTDMDMSRWPAGEGKEQGRGSSGGWGDTPQRDDGVRMNPRGGLEMPSDGGGSGQQPYPDPSRRGGPMGGGDPLPMPGNRVPQVPGNADNPFGDLAEIIRKGFGLPGGSGGPIIIPLPGGINLPFPMPGGGGQGGGMQMPMPQPQGGGQGGGFPWPQPGGGGLPMPQGGGGQGGGFPWPQGGGGGLPMPQGGGGAGQGNPLPMPGGGRGIELPGGQVGGSMLWNIIRTILGSALGFQSRGIMSWLIRMVFMKYGWSILRTILGMGRR